MIDPIAARPRSRVAQMDSTPVDHRSMRVFELATAAAALLAAVLLAVVR